MNQILDYNPIKNGDSDNNYNSGTPGNKGNIIKVFAIILIIFAVCLIGIGVFNKYANNSGADNDENKKTEAIIELVQDGSELFITVKHDKEIQKLIYNWNTSSEKTIAVDTGKIFETTIDIPAGNNTLNIQVVDIEGNKTFKNETIQSEEGIDIINPVIKYEITEGKKLKIVATDETELDFLTYRWNDEEETTVEPKDINPKKVEIEIDIKTGTNNLTITAVDKNNNNESLVEVFEGLLQPKIEVVLAEDKSKLIITTTHEKGIATIEYTLNDNPYFAELPEGSTEVSFEQPLEQGKNIIVLKVTSVEGTTSEFAGQCTYTPDIRDITVE